jgi:hypothetical protein
MVAFIGNISVRRIQPRDSFRERNLNQEEEILTPHEQK